jgi:hypothetical protein
MVGILESWLRPADVGFEWGSGRSTCWFARRSARLVSVEHDRLWHARVSSRVAEAHLDNVEYLLRETQPDYVTAVHSASPESLDYCLVDGEWRDLCARAAIPRLKTGGILILDNCNWFLPSVSRSPNSRRLGTGASSTEWEAFLAEVSGWRCIWTSNGVTDTAMWVKPSAADLVEPVSR